MPIVNIDFSRGDRVGYIVRYKTSHTHEPSASDTHADCVTHTGAPCGYFGSGAFSGGSVVLYTLFQSIRPQYVNLADARGRSCISTIIVSECGAANALKFRNSWISMRAATGDFAIVGNNCSTHASKACFKGGLIRVDGVDGVDTPNNLYNQIVSDAAFRWTSYSGYLYFTPVSSGPDELLTSFTVSIDTTVVSTTGGPSPGGGGSSSY